MQPTTTPELDRLAARRRTLIQIVSVTPYDLQAKLDLEVIEHAYYIQLERAYPQTTTPKERN